ncbi:SRPBCC family protein [Streptomyces sp. NBC_00078]|uniref:SRPBCC family protein n=1 Tax=unclassified Streptomyces TaxID=2593676 RepID=UPI002251E166|nr:SRPBCC family protein [Streptomyces sp. NBC_00078]MCX5418572.1 SRPBCC family protein [Streptomyces sp. NBC_00078]
MSDVTHDVSAVRRQVGRRTFKAGEARVVSVARSYDAPLDDVWDACTNPERIPRWLLPVSGDLRLGGRYQLEGNAGGVIERCDPPTGFAATWEYGGEVSWIELRLTPEEGGTRFELDHIAHADDTKWAEFGPGAVGVGWDLMVRGLSLHLASGAAVDPKAFRAWMGSDEGRQFMASSSEAWFAANVFGGEDEKTARESADRTTAAYTGA